jgi:hypothetical protein
LSQNNSIIIGKDWLIRWLTVGDIIKVSTSNGIWLL